MHPGFVILDSTKTQIEWLCWKCCAFSTEFLKHKSSNKLTSVHSTSFPHAKIWLDWNYVGAIGKKTAQSVLRLIMYLFDLFKLFFVFRTIWGDDGSLIRVFRDFIFSWFENIFNFPVILWHLILACNQRWPQGFIPPCLLSKLHTTR